MTTIRHTVLDQALRRNLVPAPVLRAGTRALLSRKLERLRRGGLEAQAERKDGMALRARSGSIAEAAVEANDQHYELPPEFMALMLGPRMKYSAGWWHDLVTDLAGAEDAMLDVSARRARVADGMSILDLGCGWGAMTCWLLEHYDVEVTAVSNSSRQTAWILAECERRGVADRVEIVTANVEAFEPSRRFDRIVSIEMLEHLRNWHHLLTRVSEWLSRDGLIFIHIFAHREFAYQFRESWASERFFTGGTMPSHDLLLRATPPPLQVERSWQFDGTHYSRTIGAWLERFWSARDEALSTLVAHGYSLEHAQLLIGTWRLFLLSTAEMWGLRRGQEWGVSHYLFSSAGSGVTQVIEGAIE